ncbi:FAD-dependent oxidoreductase [Arthrobacter sp. zg-ZUI100]|uniref:NAD(P)/FAD-dependent oxidoreductase n=1 Tax=Arthrobacter jiangjiafuii TaxID=2817475 RepID=UPI001AEF0A68|nr:FAD-dependent oxidoreductase [Arthrobacter jiangjiafuii]MBP3037757.1 FAD-dependent oxidoreductase [Arthrobacter jiangjiafuii]
MKTNVVIVGGGYAGVMAANRLAATGRSGHDVVLVNPGERFVERIRLHEYAAGTRKDPTVSFASVLNPDVRQVRDAAERIDAGTRTVQLAGGRRLEYDYLVYAVGSGRGKVPEGSYAVEQFEGADEARRALAGLPPGGRVAVVGGGLTAIETASETARRYPGLSVSLHAAGLPAPQVGAGARRGLERSLRRMGIELHAGTQVPASGDPHTHLGADVVLWCAGFGVPELAAASGLPVDAAGRLLVAPTLQVPGQERIYGAGDAAVIAGADYAYLRMSCAAAMPMGADAATNILRSLDALPAVWHDSGFGGQCVSLGRTDGMVQFVTADDTPVRLHVHGRTAAVLKEIICRMTLRWIRNEAKRSGAYTWPKGPRRTTATAQQQAPAWN